MKIVISGNRIAGVLAAGLLSVVMVAHPGQLIAQAAAAPAAAAPAGATIHGHVQNPAGMALATGEVRLTTDRSANANSKYDYKFPIDASGNYKGAVDKPGNYIAVVFQGANSIDFQSVIIGSAEDKTVDFDMTRKAYLDNMSPEDKQALEDFKKKNAETMTANSKISNLNAMLKSARADTASGSYDSAIKTMTDATAAKPDEPILWQTLGDAQLGQANAAAKTAKDSKTTDPTVNDKFEAAEASYQKAIALNVKLPKPNPEITAAANNQMGQALSKTGKIKEAAAAYEAAAMADPTKAGTYYFNEAATLFNQSDMDGAAAAADKAITADPTKADAYFIKGQSLVQKATVDPKTNVITAPPDCIAAYQKYLELAPDGPHAQEVKDVLAGIGVKVTTNYKAGAKK